MSNPGPLVPRQPHPIRKIKREKKKEMFLLVSMADKPKENREEEREIAGRF